MIVLILDGRMDGSSASGHGRSGERCWRVARHVGIVAGAAGVPPPETVRDGHDQNGENAGRDGPLEECQIPIGTVELKHADQLVVGDGGQDHAHDDGGRRIAVYLQHVAECAAAEHEVDVELGVAETERAEDGEQHKTGDQDPGRHR